MKYIEEELRDGGSRACVEFNKIDFMECIGNPFSPMEKAAVERAKKTGLASGKLYALVLFARRVEQGRKEEA